MLAVIDTNVIISGLYSKRGASYQLLRAVTEEKGSNLLLTLKHRAPMQQEHPALGRALRSAALEAEA